MMFSHKKNLWFTLIEMMVVITIFSILLLSSYVPYSYMQNKALLKIGTKDVSQTLYQARNLAINGFENENKNNASIGVYFDTTNPDIIEYYSFPYSIEEGDIIPEENTNIKKIKEIVLPKWVQIDSVYWKEKFLFFFNAITWKGDYYYWENWSMVKSEVPTAHRDIIIKISFRWSTSSNLQKQIIYYTPTHILDY